MTTEEIYARLRMVKRTTPVGDPDCGSGAGGNRRPWEEIDDDARASGGDGAALTVITCDAAVTAMHKVRTLSSIRQLELTGGCGTDMVAGIAACAALRPAPEVVVVMTDGDTLWPATPGTALRNTRVIALLTRSGGRWRSVPDWIATIIADPDQRMNTGDERCT